MISELPPDVLARIDPDDLEHLRELEQSAADKPWMLRAANRERERLVIGAEVEARLAERHRRRQRRSQTVVFTVRLDVDEVYALERRAAYLGMAPRVLARNLIRVGLRKRETADLIDLVENLERTAARLREGLA